MGRAKANACRRGHFDFSTSTANRCEELPAAKNNKRNRTKRAGSTVTRTLVTNSNASRTARAFDYAYFAGSGVTFEVSIRIFQSSP